MQIKLTKNRLTSTQILFDVNILILGSEAFIKKKCSEDWGGARARWSRVMREHL